MLRGKVGLNCSVITFANKVAWRRQGDVVKTDAAAGVFVGKAVAGAAEMHGRMQQDAATGSFFSKGFMFRLPSSTQSVIIDIGLYDDILRPAPGQHVIAIEASMREAMRFDLPAKCEALQNCTLIMAAVGDGTDRLVDLWESHRPFGSATITSSNPRYWTAQLHTCHRSVVNGSIALPLYCPARRQWPMDRGFAVVPMIPFKAVIDAVPAHLSIALCKLDTNGNDVLVLRSAGYALRRCEEVRMEIVSGGQGGPLHQHRAALSLFRSLGFARYARREEVWKGQYDLMVWKNAGPEGTLLQSQRTSRAGSGWSWRG